MIGNWKTFALLDLLAPILENILDRDSVSPTDSYQCHCADIICGKKMRNPNSGYPRNRYFIRDTQTLFITLLFSLYAFDMHFSSHFSTRNFTCQNTLDATFMRFPKRSIPRHLFHLAKIRSLFATTSTTSRDPRVQF